jgi:hypothetical protein
MRPQALIFSQERVRRTARYAVAGFHIWGGCFILGAASAMRVPDLHGALLALARMIIPFVKAFRIATRRDNAA